VTNGFGIEFEIKQFQEQEKLFQSSTWHQITNGMSRSLMMLRWSKTEQSNWLIQAFDTDAGRPVQVHRRCVIIASMALIQEVAAFPPLGRCLLVSRISCLSCRHCCCCFFFSLVASLIIGVVFVPIGTPDHLINIFHVRHTYS
jgi:hypothetical protein